MENLPKRFEKFVLDDFFQLDVDEFENGYFLFLSVKKVKPKLNEKVTKMIDRIDDTGFIISTYCYCWKSYYKIFVCDYMQKPWQNEFHIRDMLATLNGCHGFAVQSDMVDFTDWMRSLKNNEMIYLTKTRPTSQPLQ